MTGFVIQRRVPSISNRVTTRKSSEYLPLSQNNNVTVERKCLSLKTIILCVGLLIIIISLPLYIYFKTTQISGSTRQEERFALWKCPQSPPRVPQSFPEITRVNVKVKR